MKLHFKRMQQFMGIMRNLDPAEMPFGMAVTSQNLAQYVYGRMQRIAGITSQVTAQVDGGFWIPLGIYVREIGGTGTTDQPTAVYVGSVNQLTLQQFSVEGTLQTGDFTAQVGTEVLSQDCTTSKVGTCSLKVVTQATNLSGFYTGSNAQTLASQVYNAKVVAGLSYAATIWAKTSASQAGTIVINWYNASGGYISTSAAVASMTTTFTAFTVTATAPAGATYANIGIITSTATAVTIWADNMQLEQAGAPTTVVAPGSAGAARVVSLTSGAQLSGPALAVGASYENWMYAFYAQQHLIASDQNGIMQLTAAGTYAAWSPTGSPPAKGGLIRAFLDRLYWAGDQTNAANEGIVFFTDALTKNFGATGFVNVKEIPGPVTALGVYEPSTGATAGAVGIKGGLLIFKRNGIWYWDESSKDLISGKIGTVSPHTVQNSPVGTIFLGKRGEQNSVFVIPPGYYGYIHFGEPIDVGKPLYNLLNGFNVVTWLNASQQTVTWTGATWSAGGGLNNPITAHGVIDGKFYKLFVSLGNDTQNQTELWLDLDALQENPGETRGGQAPTAIWYGPHTRGGYDASFVDEALGAVRVLSRNYNNRNSSFTENLNLSQNFTDWKGNTLIAFLDLAMNFDPEEVEKTYDVTELHIAPEADLTGLFVTYTFLADNVSQGQGTAFPEMDLSGTGAVTHILIPSYASGRSGVAAHHGRLQIVFTPNQRFDIIGIVAQYIVVDTQRIFPHVRM